MKHFRFFCYNVLPLVYDDSLSYYEVLCKVVDYINKMIDDGKIVGDVLISLQKELSTAKKWIEEFDTTGIKDIVDEYINTMIFVELSDDGYIIYNIPNTWDNIEFRTSGLDIDVEADYGHLVLLY